MKYSRLQSFPFRISFLLSVPLLSSETTSHSWLQQLIAEKKENSSRNSCPDSKVHNKNRCSYHARIIPESKERLLAASIRNLSWHRLSSPINKTRVERNDMRWNELCSEDSESPYVSSFFSSFHMLWCFSLFTVIVLETNRRLSKMNVQLTRNKTRGSKEHLKKPPN